MINQKMKVQKKEIKLSKRMKKLETLYEGAGDLSLTGVINRVKEGATAKFNESIDVVVALGIDARKSDQNVRGSYILPHGTGKTVRVLVFAASEDAKNAKEAGADIVGSEELIEEIKNGRKDFDFCIATPDLMPKVSAVAQILGKQGKMPNPKLGTVTKDVANAVKNLRKGSVFFKNDKFGYLHCQVGKKNFSVEQLEDNIKGLIKYVSSLKPTSSKGDFLRDIHISSSMGIGLQISPKLLLA